MISDIKKIEYKEIRDILFQPDNSDDPKSQLINFLEGKYDVILDPRGEELVDVVEELWVRADEKKRNRIENAIKEAIKCEETQKKPYVLDQLLYLAVTMKIGQDEVVTLVKKLNKFSSEKKEVYGHSLSYWVMRAAYYLDITKGLNNEFITYLNNPEICHVAYIAIMRSSPELEKEHLITYLETMRDRYENEKEADEKTSILDLIGLAIKEVNDKYDAVLAKKLDKDLYVALKGICENENKFHLMIGSILDLIHSFKDKNNALFSLKLNSLSDLYSFISQVKVIYKIENFIENFIYILLFHLSTPLFDVRSDKMKFQHSIGATKKLISSFLDSDKRAKSNTNIVKITLSSNTPIIDSKGVHITGFKLEKTTSISSKLGSGKYDTTTPNYQSL